MDNQDLKNYLSDIKDDSEWKGYVSATLKTIAKNQEDLKQEFRTVVNKLDDDVQKLKVKVAGWSALFSSIASVIMAVLISWIRK